MKETIEKFYQSFTNLDPEGMAACYHKDVHFNDPAFGDLKGERAGNMWRMLLSSQKGKDFRVKYSNIQSTGETVSADWEAFYTFSQTGRKVHNNIHAEFKFKDGKIIEHIDDFNLHKWAKQAMGTKGSLIGWTGFFKKKLNTQTNKLLTTFEQTLKK